MNDPAEKMSKAAHDMNKAADDMNKAAENFERASEEMQALDNTDENGGVVEGTDTVVDSAAGATETGVKITNYTDAGDIGEEQMPAFDEKAHTRAWSYDVSRTKTSGSAEKVKDFVAGL